MPTLVLLQFDDKEDLARFHNFHDDDQGVQVGEYYLPSERVYCRCNMRTRIHVNNWRRHPRFGLWVCKMCKRPSRAWRLGLDHRITEALGYNLMKL